MNIMKRSVVFLLLGFACASLCAAGTVYGVKAEETASVTPETAGLEMTAGASVRMAESKELTGIRWAVTMPADTYNALESSAEYTEVSYGILIAPYAYHKATPLTAASVFGAGGEKVYGWADEDGVYEESYTQIINLETEQLYTSETDAENVHFYGSIVDILEKNLAGDFIGIGYIGYTTAEGETSYVFAAENDNARSAAYVAQKAIEDTSAVAPSEEKKAWLQENYVDPVKTVDTTVTVKHLTADGEELQAHTSKNFKIDSVINSADCAEAIDGYVVDASKNAEYKVYASGKTVVNVYYQSAIEANGGFELGDLTGWTVEGDGANISEATTYWENEPNFHDMDGQTVQTFDKEGNYFLMTDQGQTVTLKSPVFTLSGDGIITFKLGTAKNAVCYVAVCDAETNEELIKVTNEYFNDPLLAEIMLRRFVYAGDYIGEELYVKVVDGATSAFGFVTFDDLQVSLTQAEAEAIAGADKERMEVYRQDVLDSTAGMGGRTKEIVSSIQNYYKSLVVEDARGVIITQPAENQGVVEGTVNLNDYISGVQGKMLGVDPETLVASVVRVSDGKTEYTQGFEAFGVKAGKTYTVTYRLTEPDSGKCAEATFDLVVSSSNQVINGGFETGDLTGWTYQEGTGNGQILGSKAVISDPTWWNERIPYNQGGNYHFDGWAATDGKREADTYTLKSSTFTLGGSGWISFKMGGRTACVKVYKEDGTKIGDYKNTAFADIGYPNLDAGCRLATMTTFVADLSGYLGEELYIELRDEGGAPWGEAFFDDIVTYYETAPDYANQYDTVQFYEGGYADGKEAINYDIKWVLAVNVL